MRRTGIDGEGVVWAVGAFAASLLIGVLVQPFRKTMGLENVAILYLLVVVAAAGIGGRAAGMVAALSAALSYDYFLTTPYHTLVIDTLAQVITRGVASCHRHRGQHRRPGPTPVSNTGRGARQRDPSPAPSHRDSRRRWDD
jgi:K+-sensing histidine kinase KdpD